MSKENTKRSVSKATNVARDNNHDSNSENRITSEFVIISSDCSSEEKSNLPTTNEEIADLSSRKKKTNNEQSSTNSGKKANSKGQYERKIGPNARTLEWIRQQQKDREKATIEAIEETKRIERQNQDEQEKQEEALRLEKEHREKMQEQKRNRIQRQRETGTYLTKGQRKKYYRAQVQLGAVGIEIPERNTSQISIIDKDNSTKRRILYDDRRNSNKMVTDLRVQSMTTTIESQDLVVVDYEDISEQSDTNPEEYEILSTAESYCKCHSDIDSNDDKAQIEVISNEINCSISTADDLGKNNQSINELRAPVICVLGHVDAGKTTLLDNLRRTHVQATEANGITQQIGATNVPLETIHERIKMCRNIITDEGDLKVPGLLIIDTPGHETFKNLRSRGSSLCDLAILVVDIMHGLAPQTIEAIKLLKERKTPFIIALTKVDRLYDWKHNSDDNIEIVYEQQSKFTQNQFERQCNQIIAQFAEQWLNVALYFKNPDPNEFYSMVPVSARTGDGMGSLIALIVEKCQTSLAERLTYTNELQATVMEVKKNDDLGTTIDVILVNGCLSVGDTIFVASKEAPIITRIRELLIPESNQEIRVTNQYKKYKTIKGACSMKICAQNLEKAIAGFPLFVIQEKSDIERHQQEIETMLRTALNSFELQDKGVYVQASTLGSLEALLQLLKTSKIPYAGINIGSVHRKDVIRASTQLEKDVEWATILAFDVKIEKDAQDYAKTIGVKIIQHDEIYRLHDMFKIYQEEIIRVNQENYRHLAIFPCKLRILSQYVFNSRNPIICGVRIEAGFLRLNTPICVPSRDGIDLGRITSIEKNNKSLDIARIGDEVCIKIETNPGETPKMYRRHFDETDLLVSKISRESIDVLKKYFRDHMQIADWKLIIELKQIFEII